MVKGWTSGLNLFIENVKEYPLTGGGALDKEKVRVPFRTGTQDLPDTGWALLPLSYTETLAELVLQSGNMSAW